MDLWCLIFARGDVVHEHSAETVRRLRGGL